MRWIFYTQEMSMDFVSSQAIAISRDWQLVCEKLEWKVIGIGEKKTLKPFITACDKFIYIEILKAQSTPDADDSDDTDEVKKAKNKNNGKSANYPLKKIDPKLIRLVEDSISDLEDEDGWTFLGELGNLMLKKNPDFDPRNYGFQKLLPLIKSLKKFEIDARETGKNNIKHIYVRN